MNFAKFVRAPSFYRTSPECFEHHSVLIFVKINSVKKSKQKALKY